MTNKPDFTAFLQTQGNARRFSAPLAYMKFMDGSHVGAIFLEHMLFWYSKGGGKDGWFYKSAKEWYAETGLSTDSVKRYTKMLVQLGVLETKLYPANGAPTTHFRLDAEKLYTILVEALSNQAEDDGSGTQGKTAISHWLETPNAFDDTDKTIWAKPQKEKQGKKQQEKPRPFEENPKSITAASEAEENSELFSFREKGNDEKSSPHPQDSLTIPSNSGLDVVNQGEYRALHNVGATVVSSTSPIESIAQVFAAELPAEPVKARGKPKRTAAKPKTPKPPKEPDAREAAFIAQIEKLDTYIAEDMRTRCGTYRASDPWSVSQVYILTKVRILKPLWSDIAAINGESFDAALLLKVYKAWIAKHNDPHNLAWLLEWYKAGGPPQYGKYNQQAQQQPASAPSKLELTFDDPLVEDVAQWVYAKPGYKGKGLYDIKLAMWCALNGKPTQHLGNADALLVEYQAAH